MGNPLHIHPMAHYCTAPDGMGAGEFFRRREHAQALMFARWERKRQEGKKNSEILADEVNDFIAESIVDSFDIGDM